MSIKKEACVESLEQSLLAEKCGAHRIELCSDLTVGGLTPSASLLRETLSQLRIPVMVMARPRVGDFTYNKKELRAIKSAIEAIKSAGAKGVVFGFLTKENLIDLEITAEMALYARPLEVTFHKAIDLTPDPVAAAVQLASLGLVHRILTSGGQETALAGKETLKRMIAAMEGKMEILVAGKVTKENLPDLHREIGAREYHGRRIVF